MTYELRTVRGKAIMTFDNEARARDYLTTHARRVGIALHLFKVWKQEERVA